MNLFTTAAANVANLERRFDAAKSTLSSTDLVSVVSFATLVKDYGLVGINMRQTVLIIFLTTGEYENIYEWASATSSITRKPVDETLRKRLDKYYDRRLLFDNSFDNGIRFRYGALVTSGPGATSYGEYCTLLSAATTAKLDVTYLIGDSLRTYILAGPTLDTKAIVADAAVEESKHFLAGIKHHRTIPTTPETEWGVLLCNKDDYIEAIFDGTLSTNHIEEIRIQKSDYDLYFHFAYDEITSMRSLDAADREFVEGFAFIIKFLKKRGIRLEVV